MTHRSKTAMARRLAKEIDRHGAVIIRGMHAVQVLRDAIKLLTDEGRLVLTFDPASDATLRDYLGAAAGGGLEGMLAGGGIGLVIGLLLERPAEGFAIGMALGGAAGALAGINKVRRGWRLRATWSDGTAVVEIQQS